MKITRILKRYAGISLCLCLLGAGMTGCIKDDDVAGQKETTLTLRFSTGANAPDQDGTTVGPELPNEHMRTLRVILTETDGTIRYNTKITGIPEDADEQVVTFSELITVNEGETKFNVYAIANEEAFVTSPDQLAAESGNVSQFGFNNNTLLNASVLARLNEAVNKENPEANERIPQTAVEEVAVVPKQANSATIQLEFVVAKIDLSFTNQSPSSVDLPDVTFSHMNVADTPLFPATSLPSTGTDLSLGTVSVPGGATNYSVVRYVYESQVPGNDNYILSTSWGNNSLNLSDAGLGTEFARGTKLDIDITLNSTHITTFDLLVEPWGQKDNIVPPFL